MAFDCKNIINKLYEVFKEEEIPALIRQQKGLNNDIFDVLCISLDMYGAGMIDVVGEFCFLPWGRGDKNTAYFSSKMILSEKLGTGHMQDMYQAISIINAHMALGALTIDPKTKALSYSFTVPIDVNFPEEAVLREADLAIGHALDVAEPYTDILIKLSKGECRLSEIEDLFPEDYE